MSRVPSLVLLTMLLSLCGASLASGEDDDASLASLQRLAANAPEARGREKAAETIARRFYEPEVLIPWLEARMQKETSFHVRLALGYALAAQGEKKGLEVLVDSLQRMGHLGYVYLTRVSGKRIGGPGRGWDVPAWNAWMRDLEPEAWRDLIRKRNLPRHAIDADAEGLARAVAWWDGLGLVDVVKHPFVRVIHAWKGRRPQQQTHTHGFLLLEDPQRFTVFTVSMHEAVFDRVAHDGNLSVSFEPVKLAEAPMQDQFMGLERELGFPATCALWKKGKQEAALERWKAMASWEPHSPRHGTWSALEQLKRDMARARREVWEASLRDPEKGWSDLLAAFRADQERFADVADAKDLALLESMAKEAARYETAKLGGNGTPAEQAAQLVLALPTVRRAFWNMNATNRREDAEDDALSRLIALGLPAVPALLPALDDMRFTRSYHHGQSFKAYIRPPQWPLRVHALAEMALRAITAKDFREGNKGPAAIRAAAEAWHETLTSRGAKAVLIEGVQAVDRSSPGQAKLLVAQFPDSAFEVIEEAFYEAESGIAAGLLSALAPLRTKEVKRFLLEQAKEGDLGDRMAAARALHEQEDDRGAKALLRAWPDEVIVPVRGPGGMSLGREPKRGYVELVYRMAPIESLARMRETLEDTPPVLVQASINEMHVALGYRMFYRHGEKPDFPRPPGVRDAVESYLVHLTLDEDRRNGRLFEGDEGTASWIGEAAAGMLSQAWPELYTFDRKAARHDRLAQRYAIVNTWRKAHGEPLLKQPEPFRLEGLPAATVDPLLDAWLAARDDEARATAADAIEALGLAALPAVRARQTKAQGNEAAVIEALARRLVRIVREITWVKDSPKPSAAMAKLVAALKGRPVEGRDLTNLFRECFVAPTSGTSGIRFTLSRPGDGTGFVMKVAMTTHEVPWPRTNAGFILSGSGRELVDAFADKRDSWWHKARSKQLDKILDRPVDQEVTLSRSFVRVKQ